MEVLDNVERIEAPDPETFHRDYVLPRRPVILTNLYQGQPLRELIDPAVALHKLADLQLVVREEYTTTFFQGKGYGTSSSEAWSLAQYVAFARENPTTRKLVVEYPPPAALKELFQPAPICRPPLAKTLTFLANPGNYAHLHFDWEVTHNILYQVFGSKRAIIVPARQAAKLNSIMTVGTCLLENMKGEEKLQFLRYLGAYDCVIGPGDALYMPMMDWHHLEYVDLSLSVATRFAENPLVRELFDAVGGELSLQRDCVFQNVGATLNDVERIPDAHRAEVQASIAKIRAIEGPALDVYRGVRDEIRALLARILPGGLPAADYNYFPRDQLQEDLVRDMFAKVGLV